MAKDDKLTPRAIIERILASQNDPVPMYLDYELSEAAAFALHGNLLLNIGRAVGQTSHNGE